MRRGRREEGGKGNESIEARAWFWSFEGRGVGGGGLTRHGVAGSELRLGIWLE